MGASSTIAPTTLSSFSASTAAAVATEGVEPIALALLDDDDDDDDDALLAPPSLTTLTLALLGSVPLSQESRWTRRGSSDARAPPEEWWWG